MQSAHHHPRHPAWGFLIFLEVFFVKLEFDEHFSYVATWLQVVVGYTNALNLPEITQISFHPQMNVLSESLLMK